MRLWLGRRSHVQALILNTSACDAWRRLPATRPCPSRLSGHLAHRRSCHGRVVAASDVGGLQICRRRATDSLCKAVYVSEQVCIRWRSTGVYYTAKLTFSHGHDLPIKVWGAYYTSVRIIFEFLRYTNKPTKNKWRVSGSGLGNPASTSPPANLRFITINA